MFSSRARLAFCVLAVAFSRMCVVWFRCSLCVGGRGAEFGFIRCLRTEFILGVRFINCAYMCIPHAYCFASLLVMLWLCRHLAFQFVLTFWCGVDCLSSASVPRWWSGWRFTADPPSLTIHEQDHNSFYMSLLEESASHPLPLQEEMPPQVLDMHRHHF